MTLNTIAIVVVIALFVSLLLWRELSARRQRRVLGRSRYRDCAETTKLLGRFSGRLISLAGTMWLSLAAGTYILVSQIGSETNILLTLAGLLSLTPVLASWAKQSAPASILVLGNSAEEQIALQAAIRGAVFPFRPVSFLQTDLMRMDMKIAGDCFRIDRGVAWSEAVFAFCRAVPLIVLDVRRITPFVREEVQHVFEAGHAYKTLFIGPAEAVENPETRVCRLPDTESALGLLRYVFIEREILPAPDIPLSSSGLEMKMRPGETATSDSHATRVPASDSAGDGAWLTTEVRSGQLRPFSYQTPQRWHRRVLTEKSTRYAVLLRPQGDDPSGIGGWLRRRLCRLDLMVFTYTDGTIADEESFRRATTVNVARQGASITRERIFRRGSVLCHECFFQLGRSQGYLVRFITNGNEYVVRWAAMDGATMHKYLPIVEEFAERLET